MVFADAHEVGRYRKKPVVVEARKFVPEYAEDIAEWCGGEAIFKCEPGEKPVVRIEIETLEGTMRATPDEDWIIKGTHGEFYPIKEAVFLANYEPVE